VFASSKPWNRSLTEDLKLHSESKSEWVHSPEELENLINASPNIRYIFFLHWNWLVPEFIWSQYECVCFHMTDVPYGRGGSPLQNLIIRGHKDTVLTALRMVDEMDAGPVYTKRPLSLDGTAHEIYLRASKLSFEIIDWIVSSEPTPVAQSGQPVVFKRRNPTQSKLPIAGSMRQVYDHVRMLDAPTYPHAFVDHGEFRIEFSEARLGEEEVTATVRIYKKSEQE
jgi:methionyl-tRNA formyltransferase